jgi:hypothetical protein
VAAAGASVAAAGAAVGVAAGAHATINDSAAIMVRRVIFLFIFFSFSYWETIVQRG